MGKVEVLFNPIEPGLTELFAGATESSWIVSPWIKADALDVLPEKTGAIHVLTRFNVYDFRTRVSDIAAAERLLEVGAEVRLISQLHAKIYLVEGRGAVFGSPNLTRAGTRTNLEIACSTTDERTLEAIQTEVKWWWSKAKPIDRRWLARMRALLDRLGPLPQEDDDMEGSQEQERLALEGPAVAPTKEAQEDPDWVPYEERYVDLPLPTEWLPLLRPIASAPDKSEKKFELLEVDPTPVVAWVQEKASERSIDMFARQLPPKETLEEIGQSYGLTKERVRQIINTLKRRLYYWGRRDLPDDVEDFIQKIQRHTAIYLRPSPNTKLQDLRYAVEIALVARGLSLEAETTESGAVLVHGTAFHRRLQAVNDFVKTAETFKSIEETSQGTGLASDWIESALPSIDDLYLTADGRLGHRKWTYLQSARSIAWELANADPPILSWHKTELLHAAQMVFPQRFQKMTPAHFNSTFSRADFRAEFNYMGRKGVHGLRAATDGHDSNKDAIVALFAEHNNEPLDAHYLFETLHGNDRQIEWGTLYAILWREPEFHTVDHDGTWIYAPEV